MDKKRKNPASSPEPLAPAVDEVADFDVEGCLPSPQSSRELTVPLARPPLAGLGHEVLGRACSPVTVSSDDRRDTRPYACRQLRELLEQLNVAGLASPVSCYDVYADRLYHWLTQHNNVYPDREGAVGAVSGAVTAIEDMITCAYPMSSGHESGEPAHVTQFNTEQRAQVQGVMLALLEYLPQGEALENSDLEPSGACLLYTSPSPRD